MQTVAARAARPEFRRGGLSAAAGARRAGVVAAVVTAATFGPVIPGLGGLRTDQVALYFSIPYAIYLAHGRGRMTQLLSLQLLIWVTYATAGLVVPLIVAPTLPMEQNPLLSGLDNALTPAAGLLLASLLAAVRDPRELALIVLRTVVWGLLINTLLQVGQAVGVIPPSLFSDGSALVEAVATDSRFLGVFGQPLEAGLAYGAALLALLTLPLLRGRWLWVAMFAMALGGVLTGSKNFLAAIALAFAFLAVRSVNKVVTAVLSLVPLSCLAVIFAGDKLLNVLVATGQRLSGFGSDWVGAITAGRLSMERPGTLNVILDMVNENSPWFGFGHGGLALSYDSQWVEAYVVLGVLGVLLTVAMFVLLVFVVVRLGRGPWRDFAVLLSILLFVAAIGGPALTGNRTASWTWMLVGLLTIAGSAGAYDRFRNGSRAA